MGGSRVCTVDGALIGVEKLILSQAMFVALLDPIGPWFMGFKANSLTQLCNSGQKLARLSVLLYAKSNSPGQTAL